MSDDLTIEPVNRTRLSQRIVLRICELIRDNRLSAGDRLPPERELAERLQVSRASLREALTALELAGIVETRHGDGTRVRDFHELGVTSPLAMALSATDDLVGDLWELRLIFEPALAAQAALRATDNDIAAMRVANNEIGRLASHLESAERTIDLDREFHATVARASGNRAAVRVLQLLNELLLSSRRHFAAEPNRRHRTFTSHNEIIDAIDRHDLPTARDSMLRHLQDVELYIVGSVIEEHLDIPPGAKAGRHAGAASSDAAHRRTNREQKGGNSGGA